MTKVPRGLTTAEAQAWSRLASTVTPLDRNRPAPWLADNFSEQPRPPAARGIAGSKAPARVRPAAPPPPAPPTPAPIAPGSLDSHWERRLSRPGTRPDFTLDLHGHTLDQAYRRLDSGIAQAKAMGARVVLVVTGKSRPVDAADRGSARGAIRAKILDWLAAGTHASDIAAIRGAQRRHGGEGALYVILRRPR